MDTIIADTIINSQNLTLLNESISCVSLVTKDNLLWEYTLAAYIIALVMIIIVITLIVLKMILDMKQNKGYYEQLSKNKQKTQQPKKQKTTGDIHVIRINDQFDNGESVNVNAEEVPDLNLNIDEYTDNRNSSYSHSGLSKLQPPPFGQNGGFELDGEPEVDY